MINVKKAYLKFFSIILLIAFLGVILITIVSLFMTAENLKDQVKDQKTLMMSDINSLVSNIQNQLLFVQEAIQETGLDCEKIKSFFRSKKAKILNKTRINSVVITDNNFKVLFTDQFQKENYCEVDLNNTDYIESIKNSVTDQIVVGKNMLGITKNSPSIPIAVGLRDKRNNLVGALIFNINLKRNDNLINKSLLSASINNQYQHDTDDYYYITKNPISYLLFKILLQSKESIALSYQINSLQIELICSTDIIKKVLYRHYFFPGLICLAIIGMATIAIFSYYFLKRLGPIFPVMNQNNDVGEQGAVFDKLKKIVSSYYILESQYKTKENFLKFMLKGSLYLSNQICDRSMTLKEEIEDALEEFYSKNKIYEAAANHQEEVHKIVCTMYAIVEKLNISKLEEVNILNKLIEAGLSPEMIRIEQLNSEHNAYPITKLHSCDLLESLLSSVILYLGGPKEILLVEISIQNNLCIMKFLYNRDFVYESLQAINFINCSAWALVSNAAIKINFHEDNSMLLLQI